MADDLTVPATAQDWSGGVEDLIARVSASPLAMANLARTLLLPKGEDERARELCRKALEMAPDDREVGIVVAEVLSHRVGRWYFSMVQDDARHCAYRAALETALAGGGRVLDVGSGTALFAMLAAQAGAHEVISCERRPAVAEAAAAVVAQNGLSEQIRILSKASQDIQIGVDMAGPADLLIWDNLTNDMMGAGALAGVEDAVRRLLRPGARVIPARCQIKAALAEDRERWRRTMQTVAGFDLTPFNRLAKPFYELEAASSALAIRSTETTVFDFDLQSGGPFPAAATRSEVTGLGGEANGAVLWLDFHLDEASRYDVRPGKLSWAFGVVFFPFAAAIEARAGETFTLAGSHDRKSVRIWLEDA